jgi:protein-tyrosine phosphatase/ADP-ribosylglycohydrolase
MRKEDPARRAAPPPIPNCYWVEPGRLLAGEYPGSIARTEAMVRIQSFLRAGINSFIDLTEEGELPAYEGLLRTASEQRTAYRRMAIADHAVPEPVVMSRILDALQAELAAGRRVYIHCRAGIGRTGTAVACHLTRGGLTGEQALARLQVLWQQCARSAQWSSVPETDQQVRFVRRWNEQTSGSALRTTTPAGRREGGLLGLAVGEAFGLRAVAGGASAAEFAAQGSGTLPTGANIAQMRCVAESLLVRGQHDATDQMQRYAQWSRGAPAGTLPGELRRALASWQWSKKQHSGSHDPNNLDAHSIARTLGVALFARVAPAAAIDIAADVSRTTQQSPIVLDLCRLWAALLLDAFSGVPKLQLVTWSGPVVQLVRRRALKAPVLDLIEGRVRPTSGADAVSAIAAALACLGSSRDFRDAMLRSVGAVKATSTSCALLGTLAGAHYGIESVPDAWRRVLADNVALQALAQRIES